MGISFNKSADSDKNIDEIVKEEENREDFHNNIDILFVLDTTSSMGSYIKPAIITIQKIVETFTKMEYNLKFSLCTYRVTIILNLLFLI